MNGLDTQLVIVYFVYGLAFFSLGLVMLMEAGRTPLLGEASALLPLAVFGLVHGVHEWLDMMLLEGSYLGFTIPVYLGMIRLVLLATSFSFLIAYARRMFRPAHHQVWDLLVLLGLLSAYLMVLLLIARLYTPRVQEGLVFADVLSRYFLAVPGAAAAALAIYRQGSRASSEQQRSLATSLYIATAGFFIYALTQLIVPALGFFPASLLNTSSFYQATGLPIQVIRAGVAVGITLSLMRASSVVEQFRQANFLAIQQARLEALEQVRQDLIERESLRKELLRHTVIAQEEERARIARELHDDTAQLLTAFTLNLAALREQVAANPKAAAILHTLQDLSRRMSQGIYRLVHDLRPAQLDDLGLVAALHYLADDELKRSGVSVRLSITGNKQRIDPISETVLFRVAQEALMNVARHAQTKEASLQLDYRQDGVCLRVSDRGAGFDIQKGLVAPRGWGLAGMRERAESAGGIFRIVSKPGNGTQVEVIIPGNVDQQRSVGDQPRSVGKEPFPSKEPKA